jgi:hypothetical protein
VCIAVLRSVQWNCLMKMNSMEDQIRSSRLENVLIDRFNADARPLSPEALECLRAFLADLDTSAQEKIVETVLCKLTNGDH